ncbi:hypothetical protein JTB14_033454 [Gonioctena quinquepunctata]|nr:hypothetical protein JTB14_033454 [Gonioctena quinquepunctata]
MTPSFPVPFIEKFRKSLYPTRFLDILTQGKYYNFKPQVELNSLEHTHTPSIDIMAAVHKILTGLPTNLVCLVRIGEDVGEQVLPVCNLNLPSFIDIQSMDSESRKQIIMKIIDIDPEFIDKDLNSYPDMWHLFMLTLKYMLNRSVISWPLVYSLILCKIFISYVDPKIGFHRSIRGFNQQFQHQIRDILQHRKRVTQSYQRNIKDSLNAITFEDALLAMTQAIPYFEIDRHLYGNSRLFDRGLMHESSQYQSVFLHVKCLNQLLNVPFADFLISDCFNGTFVYNMTNDLKRRDDIDHYMKYFLRKCPLVLYSFELIVDTLKKDSSNVSVVCTKRRKTEATGI